MAREKDKLKATQPFYVMNTEDFWQEVYFCQGISHFYTFRITEGMALRTVPDACADLLFVYEGDQVRGYVCGSVLKCANIWWDGPAEFFGMRLLPGIHLAGITVSQKDLLGNRYPLDCCLQSAGGILGLMAGQSDFYQRIRVLLQEYTRLWRRRETLSGSGELVYAVKSMVYNSDGLVRMEEVEKRTGYGARYIRKVFQEEMGFSPKTFCKIIQFQRAIDYLNYGKPESMTEASARLGYYDQSQFIRDFKAYAGMTPAQYVRLVREKTYQSRVGDKHYGIAREEMKWDIQKSK